MRNAWLFSLIVVGVMCSLPGNAAAEPARKVVELFTSQGCNSCPPADRLAAELARDPGNVLISLPVDYWDYLGWKDSFAKPAFTARQKAYARARGDMQVYTPQAVVDGVTHAVGSDGEGIDTAVSAPLEVPVTGTISGDELRIEVAAAAGKSKEAQVWLVPILSAASVAIGRGENAGATVTYTNIARDLRKLGDWKGEAAQIQRIRRRYPQAGRRRRRHPLAGERDGLPGPILGATIVKLK